MADQKISADPSASDLVGAVIPIVQGGLNKKADSTLFQAALGFTPENVANKDTDGSLAANSDIKYASQKATKTYVDANLALAYGYTDSAIAGSFNYRGTYDGSSGNYPTTGGRGTSGVPAKGDAWEILSACTIQGIPYDQGDIIISKVNTPGQTTSNWGTSEHNTQQSTTSMRGTAMVVDTTTIQTPGTTDDQKMVTAIKFWQGIATLKGQTNTWALAQTFSSAPVFSSVSASQYLKVDGSKALTSVASIPDSDISYNNKNANLIFAGPTSGGAAAPTFRSLVTVDIAASMITYSRIQNVTDGSLLGNATGGAAAPSEITVENGLSLASSKVKWGGALTAASTITSTLANTITFTSSGTATANNSYAWFNTLTATSRATASDVIGGWNLNSTFIAASTNIDAQGLLLKTKFNTSSGITTGVNTGLQNPASDRVANSLAGMTVSTAFPGVSATSTSGSGTGAVFTVTTNTATLLTSINCTTPGNNFNVGETVTFNGSLFGGSGSITVAIVSTLNSFGANAAPVVSINPYSDNSGISYTAVSLRKTDGVTQLGGIGVNYLTGQGGLTKPQIAFLDPSGTAFTLDGSTMFMSRDLNLGQKNISGVATLNVSGTTTLTTVTLTSIFTASGTNDASAGNISNLVFTGTPYISVASQIKSNLRATGGVATGVPATYTVQTVGTGYSNGLASVTGGAGTGATVTLTTSAGAITAAVPLATTSTGSGKNYAVNDVLNVVQAGGASGQIKVTAIDGYGGIIAMVSDERSFTDAISNNIYASIHATPTYNITSSQAGSIYAMRYKGIHTALGSFNQYSFVYENTGSKGGIGNISPLSSWDINGSIGTAIITSTGNLTVDATHSTIIITSGTGVYTLPSASGAARRIYIFINQTGTSRTISTYKDKTGSSQTTIAASSALWLQSDASNWYQLN